MQLDDLLTLLRADRLDDNALPQLWSDDDLVGYLNDAQRQVCIRQRLLIESTNAKICTYRIQAGQRLVKLHPSILSVRNAHFLGSDGNQRCMMKGTTARRLWKRCPHWEIDDSGLPEWWVPDYQNGYLALSRTPEAAGTLQLSCWRSPLDEELFSLTGCKRPIVGEQWHIDLLDWAEYRAYGRHDADTERSEKAEQAEQAFTAKIGRLPSAIEIRLWGVSKLVGVGADFV